MTSKGKVAKVKVATATLAHCTAVKKASQWIASSRPVTPAPTSAERSARNGVLRARAMTARASTAKPPRPATIQAGETCNSPNRAVEPNSTAARFTAARALSQSRRSPAKRASGG